jgi:hypothetical protein
MLLWNLNKLKVVFGYTIYTSSILTNLIFAIHIYMMSITYFVLKFCERFFKTRSITHVIGTDIYIYTRICEQDGMEFVDLLAHERNRYRRSLPADIKHYLSRIAENICAVEFVSIQSHVFRDCVNFTNLAFWIKCHVNIGL